MTIDTIKRLNPGDLLRLIDKLELDIEDELLNPNLVPFSVEHEQLVSRVFEELEELRKERQDGSSLPIQFQDRRFSGLEDLFGDEVKNDEAYSFELPRHYNVTMLTLMLRDPEWAFAYWDISLHDRNTIQNNTSGASLCLLLQECTNCDNARTRKDVLEIPITMNDSSWYINIPKRGSTYAAVLLVNFADGQQEVLAKSAEVSVPFGALSENFVDTNSGDTGLLLAMSAIQDLGVSQYQQIPERILRYLNEQE